MAEQVRLPIAYVLGGLLNREPTSDSPWSTQLTTIYHI
jgi:hypothetical protein